MQKKMRPGISSYTYTWAVGVPGKLPEVCLTALDVIEKAAGLQVPVVQIADNLPLDKLSSEQLDELSFHAEKRHIDIETGSRGMSEDNLGRYIGIARRLKSGILRFVIDAPGYEPDMDEIHAVIRNSVPELEKAGIVLAIENHDRLLSRQFVEIIEKAGSANVGICLDTVNSMGAGEGLETVIGLLAPLTVNLHVKEFTVRRVFHKMGFVIEGVPLGRGMLPLNELLTKVSPKCETAILEMWTPPGDTVPATIRKEEEWANESINYLKQMINHV